jgi:chromate transporter
MILLRLFWEFFKTGLFAVGGGMATLPFLYDISARTGWFTTAQLAAFRQNKYVDAAFYGLRPCSLGLIAAAGVLVVQVALLNLDAYRASGNLLDAFHWKALGLAAVLLVFTRWVKPTKKLHPIVFILCSAVVGVVLKF